MCSSKSMPVPPLVPRHVVTSVEEDLQRAKTQERVKRGDFVVCYIERLLEIAKREKECIMEDNAGQIGQVEVHTTNTEIPSVASPAAIGLLTKAVNVGLTGVLVLGYNDKGEVYTDTNLDDGGDVLWLLEVCKQKLLDGGK